MVYHKQSQPIGIFDSGLGGLTITKSIIDLLPQESIIYFGDTAHLPYGDKSAATIRGYSIKIVEMLLKQNCKLIVIACNSASAAAYEVIKEHAGNQALVINVIDPIVEQIKNNYRNQNIGLIGTKLTTKSNVYQKKIKALADDITIQALATPLLVPIIEEGFANHRIMDDTLQEYLSHPNLQNLHALILGCTHYSIIKDKITKFYHGNTQIIDPTNIVAATVKSLLKTHNLLNQTKTTVKTFYVSDYTDAFAKNTELFFKQNVNLKQLQLFD